jgi:hypothetical protein
MRLGLPVIGLTAALRYRATIGLVAVCSIPNLLQSQHCFYLEMISRGTY